MNDYFDDNDNRRDGGIASNLPGPLRAALFVSLVLLVLNIVTFLTAGTGAVLSLPLLGLVDGPLALGVVYGLACLFGPLYDVVQFAYRIALIPDGLQGRVNSGFRLFAFGLNPAGAALGGWLLERGGGAWAVLLFGVATLALAITVRADAAIWRAQRPRA